MDGAPTCHVAMGLSLRQDAFSAASAVLPPKNAGLVNYWVQTAACLDSVSCLD
jgi:hypothetical protein